MRIFNTIALLAASMIFGAASLASAQTAPSRVVSLNLCTDQMALLLAKQDQLIAVTTLASDPQSSAYPDLASTLPAHNDSAESIIRLNPDLILAGTWTTRATVQLLQKLGHQVEIFAPATSLDQARANLARMGALLGQDETARALLHKFDARLDALTSSPARTRPSAVIYQARGYISGTNSLPGDLLRLAGMDNIAQRRGLSHGGSLPIEALIFDNPDLILIAPPQKGHANATELLRHPALTKASHVKTLPNGADLTCETPRLLDALEKLVTMRQNWEAQQ